MSAVLEAMNPVRQTVNVTLKPGEDGQIIAECPAIPQRSASFDIVATVSLG